MKKIQQGITFISFLIVLAIVGVFGFVAMKLFPVYVNYYSAAKDIKAVAQSSDPRSRDIQSIRTELDRRFNISYVEGIDLNKDIKLINDKGGKSIQIKYEARRPLVYNLDFVAKFDEKFPLSGKAAIE